MLATVNNVQLPYTTMTRLFFEPNNALTPINRRFRHRSLDDLLQWSLLTYGDNLTQVTSFGPTGMVILDHLARLSPGIRIVTIDTNFFFEETYALWEKVQRRYPINLDIRQTSLTPEAQALACGDELWNTDPDKCCHLRKVLPLQEALQGMDAWITGLRRDQSPTRTEIPLITWDTKYQMVKLNPLTNWTNRQVWSYIVEHKLPYNPLHDQGYASIGCTHCTQCTPDTSDERSGRWRGRSKTECGIHT